VLETWGSNDDDDISNRNEYQEYFLGGKGGRCLTTFMCRLSWDLGVSTPWQHCVMCKWIIVQSYRNPLMNEGNSSCLCLPNCPFFLFLSVLSSFHIFLSVSFLYILNSFLAPSPLPFITFTFFSLSFSLLLYFYNIIFPHFNNQSHRFFFWCAVSDWLKYVNNIVDLLSATNNCLLHYSISPSRSLL
jgi:hypothetical protein